MERNFEVGKIIAVTLLAASVFVAGAQSQEDAKKAAPGKAATAAKAATEAKTAKGPEAFIGTPDKIKWVQYSPGVEFGPVYGNCDKAGAPCVFQLRFAEGGKFPAHWHPVDENVTVLSGTFMAGMGDSYDESKMMSLAAGTYVFMPRRMHHFAGSKSGAVVQVHGVGPFKINFVNPADDPSKGAKSTK